MVNPRFVVKAVLSGQRLNINVPLTVAGTVNYIGVEAKCTSEWDDCTVACYMYQAATAYTAQLALIYDAERKLYYFPNAERLSLSAGEWAIWFVGVVAENGQEKYKITSETKYFTVYEYPFASSIPPGDITLDEQAIARATDAQNKANLILDLYNQGKLRGPKGDPGDPAEIGFVQASVDSTTSNPSCAVTVTENPENTYNMQFAFSGIKGEKGDTGATGPKGDTGAQGAPGRDGTDGRDGEDGRTIDDYVLVQAEQPTSATNKMWLKPSSDGEPIIIPTVEELNAMEQDVLIEVPLEIHWLQGNITSDGGDGSPSNANYTKRIRTPDRTFRIPTGYKVKLHIPEGKQATVYYFSNTNYATSYGRTGWETGDLTFYGTDTLKYIRVMLANENTSTTISPADAAGFTATLYLAPGDFAGKPVSYMDSGTATVRGIKITKFTDYQFVLSGSPSSTAYYKIFNMLMGANESSDLPIASPQRNITEPGLYTLCYKASQTGFSFRLTSGGTSDSLILKDGSTFEVTEPSTLFVYVDTATSYSSSSNYVTWALYKIDSFPANVPVYSRTLIDSLARAGMAENRNAINIINSPKCWGLANVLANAEQIVKLEWTPIANMPKRYDPDSGTLTAYFPANTPNVGSPYSSVRDQDKAIGMDVSIHTFMTALKDPNSVLYKRISTVENSGCYYGTVCSGLINVAFGIGLDLTNYYLSTSDMFERVPMQDLEVGDMIWISGHCALISNVEKDVYGRIAYVTVVEEWYPLPRTRKYSWSNFMTDRAGYIALRFKDIRSVQYTEIPYVQCFDETASTITYPNIQTEFGDKAVFMAGEDVNVHVINSTGYTTITVTRGDTTVLTTSTIEDFTLTNVQGGLYTITATGSNTSVSTFFVIDATASFNDVTGEVTFSSTNATPVMVGVYDLPSDRNIYVKDIVLTDADRTAGSINVLASMTATRKYAKVFFKCDYGTGVWYSENHTKWIAYNG